MANTLISLKKSSTPSAAPTNLANGELAINFADGKLFYKNTAGYIAEISGAGGGDSFATVNANGTLIVADTPNDILSLVAGDNITITGDAVNDSIIISSTSGSGTGNVVITTAIIKDLTSNDVVVTNVQSANDYGTLIDPTLFSIIANSTITLAPGEQASVTNSGNTREAKFDFSIPRGNTGPAGPKSLTISYPTASEDVTILYTEAEHILSRVSSVLTGTGGSTVSFTIRYGSDRSSAGTEVKTGGLICGSTSTANNETVFDSATVPANNFIWLETSSITGSVQEFHISLTF